MELDVHTLIGIGSLVLNFFVMIFQNKAKLEIAELKLWMVRNFVTKKDAPDV